MILCFEAEGVENENTPSVGFTTSSRVGVKARIPRDSKQVSGDKQRKNVVMTIRS